MKAATREALEGSVRKWERIVAGEIPDRGLLNCPLCVRFLNELSIRPCVRQDGERCPVMIASGQGNCSHTPYDDWRDAVLERDPSGVDRFAADDATVMCAVLELEFLRGLLPSKRGKK